MKFLKERFYYENRYDKLLISESKRIKKITEKSGGHKEVNKLVSEFLLISERGKLLDDRDETIEKRMKDDEKLDSFYNSCHPIKGLRCRKCLVLLEAHEKTKTFFWGHKNKKNRVLFIYECPQCKNRKGYYDNGEEFILEEPPCEKCLGEVEKSHSRVGNIITTKLVCKECGNTTSTILDLDEKRNYIQEEDSYTLEDYEKYGFNEKERTSYVDQMKSLDAFSDLVYGNEEKENIDKELEKIIIVSFGDLKEYIESKIDVKLYSNIEINEHKIERTYLKVTISFILLPSSSGKFNLKSFTSELEKILTNTNWRIEKSSIKEKLGLIYVNLLGYDTEEDLLKLVEKSIKRNKNSEERFRFYKKEI